MAGLQSVAIAFGGLVALAGGLAFLGAGVYARLRAGSLWQETGLVFTTRWGTPIEPRNADFHGLDGAKFDVGVATQSCTMNRGPVGS